MPNYTCSNCEGSVGAAVPDIRRGEIQYECMACNKTIRGSIANILASGIINFDE